MSRSSRLVAALVSIVALAVTGVVIGLHSAAESSESPSAVGDLPEHAGFGGNIYARSQEIDRLPRNVIRVGSTAGGGRLYAPRDGAGPANPAQVKTVWVVRGQKVWSYTYTTEIDLH